MGNASLRKTPGAEHRSGTGATSCSKVEGGRKASNEHKITTKASYISFTTYFEPNSWSKGSVIRDKATHPMPNAI